MRVFVTGATGFIGSAVAGALARDGHEVLGLVRNPDKARGLHARGVATVVGDMQAPDAWIRRAGECDAVVHAAAEHSAQAFDLDRAVALALLEAARGSGALRLLVYTSGVWVYGNTGDRRVDEATAPAPPPLVTRRVDHERLVLDANRGRVRTIVLRPGCVYGGSGSLTASWFASASEEGAARIVGDGLNRWALVHREDLARLFALAVESTLGGEILNATDGSRASVLDCAQAASRAAGAEGRVTHVPVAEAVKSMGPFADCLALDQHVDSSRAARQLGWQPRHAGFVEGVAACHLAWQAATQRPRDARE
jgi:nucleoside-diphosphate-sugar epimerase